jgi:hypothetical protein
MEFGSPSSCQKKGFGISFNQHITNTEDFLREWGGPYLSGVSGVGYLGWGIAHTSYKSFIVGTT